MKNLTCENCGKQTTAESYLPQCPSCKAWDALVFSSSYRPASNGPQLVSQLDVKQVQKMKTGTALDDVIGGIPRATAIALAGAPGAGKSTLCTQVADGISSRGRKVLYVSGEELPAELKRRGQRLGAALQHVYVTEAVELDEICENIRQVSPALVVVDSAQTVYSHGIRGEPGSMRQLKHCIDQLNRFAKNRGVAVLWLGHVNKKGQVGGPKFFEHMVDIVVKLDRNDDDSRQLESTKNRSAATNSGAQLRMTAKGLIR